MLAEYCTKSEFAAANNKIRSSSSSKRHIKLSHTITVTAVVVVVASITDLMDIDTIQYGVFVMFLCTCLLQCCIVRRRSASIDGMMEIDAIVLQLLYDGDRYDTVLVALEISHDDILLTVFSCCCQLYCCCGCVAVAAANSNYARLLRPPTFRGVRSLPLLKRK